MEKENKLIDSWIFEYLAHRCIKRYFEEGCDSEQLRQDIVIGVLTAYLNEDLNPMNRREYVCLLFLHLLCMEESLAKDDDEVDCDYLSIDEFRQSVTHCIAFSARESPIEQTKKLARLCLIQTHVVLCKHSLKTKKGLEEAFKNFQNFVNLMPTEECKEMYEKCKKLTCVKPEEDFMSEYLDMVRHLVLSLYSEFDDPQLIKFSNCNGRAEESKERQPTRETQNQNSSSNSNEKMVSNDETKTTNAELNILLQDRRPSRKSDLEEIRKEECSSISQLKRKFQGFNKENHILKIQKLEKRIKKKPPSHQNFSGGPWMPDEEKEFIGKVLDIGVGHWTRIKRELNTFRSSQQLKDKWRSVKKWQIEEVKNSR